MNENYLGDLLNKTQAIAEFNYNITRSKSSKRSMFEIFSPKINSKGNLLNQNPEELFNANNEINSILSKNLKSIFNENRDDISHDFPLFQNINSLIQQNNNNNHLFYNQMLNYHNSLNMLTKNPIYYSHINPVTESAFKNTEIIPAQNPISKDEYLSMTSIKNSKKIGRTSANKSKRKSNHKITAQKNLKKKNTKKSKKTKTNISTRKNYKFGTQKAQRLSGTYDILGEKDNNELKSLLNDNYDITKKNNSNSIIPGFHFNGLKQNSNKGIKDVQIMNNKFFLSNFNKKRFLPNNNFKFNSSIKPSMPKHSEFIEFSNNYNKNNLNNSSITKSFIEKKMPLIRRELDELNNNEISEMIARLPRKKLEKKKSKNLEMLNLYQNYQNINMNNSEKNELIPPSDKIEIQNTLEDDRFQKKYRKLFLNKNLYDSLDDEEVIDEEIIYTFYMSTNSITVYLLDSFVLIAIIVVFYYLPVYNSFYISSYRIYHNLVSSIILYFIDLIYIIDLLTGFFRAYYNFEEVLVKKNTDIFLHYLTGWFIFDLIEAIPFFTLLDQNMRKLQFKFLESNPHSTNMFDFELKNEYFALTFLKLLKIFKILNNNASLKEINKFLDKSRFFYEWKGLFSALIVTLSTLHFFSCFFIFIGRNQSQGWIVNYEFQNGNYMDLYITALYYLITTLTTVGYGDISASNFLEKIYGIFTLIVGTCTYSWILTYISNYIKKNNEKYIEFEKKMRVLNEIKLEYPNLRKSLNDRIARYLNYNKSENKYNLKFILESLPSSLQNNLIIEIYKPIIQNFQFFKSFENSDFFVKIVTSLKPILSMKEDILIQEGDIIEDIIFIKNGVLALEIIIDLNHPKKSIESHLEMTGMECFKNISYNKFTTLRNFNTLTANFRTEFGKQVFKERDKYRKEIKIIDLRKNEHFGDILMILNEKSPLAVKVKSKKAELFFLQKTEATEISNRYPNIWKRIVNRSLHNMKQIKNLIRKKLFLFSEANNIEINPELKKRYLKSQKAIIFSLIKNLEKEKKDSDNIETIVEEDDESNINSQIKNSRVLTGKFFDNKNKTLHRSILSNKNSKFVSTKKNSFENLGKIIEKSYSDINQKTEKSDDDDDNDKISSKSSEKNNSSSPIEKNIKITNDINRVGDMINKKDKEVKNSNITNQIHHLNINIYTPEVKIPINQINIENHYSEGHDRGTKDEIYNTSALGHINSEISINTDFSKDIKSNDIFMNNSDENSNIRYSNAHLNQLKQSKILGDKINYNTNYIKYFKTKKNISDKDIKNEKGDIKTNDKISNKSNNSIKSNKSIKGNESNKNNKSVKSNKDIKGNESNKSEKETKEIKEIKEIKDKNSNKFLSLDTSQSTSFTINSIYENINQISKFNYSKSSELREKTKKFILDQLNVENKVSHSMSIISKNNKKLFSTKYNMKFNPKKLQRKKTEYIDIKRKKNFTNSISLNLNSLSKKSLIVSNETRASPNMKRDLHQFKDTEKNSLVEEKRQSNVNCGSPIKNNKLKRHKSIVETENTFYNKINRFKTMKKKNIFIQEEKNEKETKITKMNYNKLIKKNIQNNQQNLNNPEEYFEEFFNDIIFNQKGNNLKENNKEDFKKRKTMRKNISEFQ